MNLSWLWYHCILKFNAKYHRRANPTVTPDKAIKTIITMYVRDDNRKRNTGTQNDSLCIEYFLS